jgi:large subunit ribosomal protein L15
MHLNTLSPAPGSHKARKRCGRGIGSGIGKTGGRGHKGQKSRSGGSVRPGFEGGQMPLKQRLPKFGFTSRKSLVRAEIRLHELNLIKGDVVDIHALKDAGLITRNIIAVKIMLSGEISRKITVRGLGVTKGARVAIEAAGGNIEE